MPVTPEVVVLLVGATVPKVAVKLAGVPFGTLPKPDVSVFAELKFKFDEMLDVPPVTTAFGVAEVRKVRYGLAATVPKTPFAVPEQPAPPKPGP